MSGHPNDPLVDLGIEGCRLGDWEIGLSALLAAVTKAPREQPLPSLVYSYVGCGLAIVEGQTGGGIEACEWAARSNRTPEHLVNLARALLAGQQNGRAYDVIESALEDHPDHAELTSLRSSLGTRQPLVFPSLRRESLVNRIAGRLRSRQAAQQQAAVLNPALEAVLEATTDTSDTPG